MKDDMAECSRNCYFYFEHGTLGLCRAFSDKDLSPPSCYSGAYIGNSCRHGLAVDDIRALKEYRLKEGAKDFLP